ncbi:MAG: ATP-NAD kinase family protein [Rhodospirillales bacterium]|nr:ATP-NAD kinase family protein [Rhodospirillales bacterium]MDE0381517.1 ATP-NAD kinase family protein [Rhodospirillales bacterium]
MATAGGPALGLIVNPIAGMGGSVGLKGTDTAAILSEARARGAEPQAARRAKVALDALAAARPSLELLAAPGPMGERIALEAGLRPAVAGHPAEGETGAADTRAAAEVMAAAGVRLILFAGGDGTARDMAAALGDRVPVIGVPAGVKMHSAVYATSPRAAADLALRALGREIEARPREVMDIDEEAFRAGAVSARLYGYLPVPYAPGLTQNVKAGGVSGDREVLAGIAAEIAGRMEAGRLYILGPGTTTRGVAQALGLPKTLLGVDLVRDGALLAADASEGDILQALADGPAGAIVVTPIGGQGHFLGRGNQQIGARVVKQVGLDRLLVAATPEKLASLGDGTLHVDTGDPALDSALAGWRRVITGFGTEAVCRVAP